MSQTQEPNKVCISLAPVRRAHCLTLKPPEWVAGGKTSFGGGGGIVCKLHGFLD